MYKEFSSECEVTIVTQLKVFMTNVDSYHPPRIWYLYYLAAYILCGNILLNIKHLYKPKIIKIHF